MFKFSVLVTLLVGTTLASANVIHLNDHTFKDVLKGDDFWMVEFYAPWCGHCKRLEPEWDEASYALSGVAKLGAVDATVSTTLAREYGVEGYPTIIVFDGDKEPERYDGERTAEAIIAFAKGPSIMIQGSDKNAYSLLSHKAKVKVLHFRWERDTVPRWLHQLSLSYNGYGGTPDALFADVLVTSAPSLTSAFGTSSSHDLYACTLDGGNAECAVFSTDFTKDAVKTFVDGIIANGVSGSDVTVPLTKFGGGPSSASVPEISQDNVDTVCLSSGKMCAILVAASSNSEARDVFGKVAARYMKDEKFTFSAVDPSSQADFASAFTGDAAEGIVIIKAKSARKRFAFTDDTSEAGMSTFFDRVLGGDATFKPVAKIPSLN